VIDDVLGIQNTSLLGPAGLPVQMYELVCIRSQGDHISHSPEVRVLVCSLSYCSSLVGVACVRGAWCVAMWPLLNSNSKFVLRFTRGGT
jgi:hypothetical protein